jgi:hypothetical protein
VNVMALSCLDDLKTVKLFLHLIKQHALKTSGVRSVIPRVLKLGNKLR